MTYKPSNFQTYSDTTQAEIMAVMGCIAVKFNEIIPNEHLLGFRGGMLEIKENFPIRDNSPIREHRTNRRQDTKERPITK